MCYQNYCADNYAKRVTGKSDEQELRQISTPVGDEHDYTGDRA